MGISAVAVNGETYNNKLHAVSLRMALKAYGNLLTVSGAHGGDTSSHSHFTRNVFGSSPISKSTQLAEIFKAHEHICG